VKTSCVMACTVSSRYVEGSHMAGSQW